MLYHHVDAIHALKNLTCNCLTYSGFCNGQCCEVVTTRYDILCVLVQFYLVLNTQCLGIFLFPILFFLEAHASGGENYGTLDLPPAYEDL